jgi:hypothetical protein
MAYIGARLLPDNDAGLADIMKLATKLMPDATTEMNLAKTRSSLLTDEMQRQNYAASIANTDTLTQAAAEKADREAAIAARKGPAAAAAAQRDIDFLLSGGRRGGPTVATEPPLPVEVVQTPAQAAANAAVTTSNMPPAVTASVDPYADPALFRYQPGFVEAPEPVDISQGVPPEQLGGSVLQPVPVMLPGEDPAITSNFRDPAATPPGSPSTPPPAAAPAAAAAAAAAPNLPVAPRMLATPSPEDQAAAAVNAPDRPAGATQAPGGAVDNGDGTITTPNGMRVSKANIAAEMAAAQDSNDPAGQERSILGQYGLIYSDDPEQVQKAMILLSEDPTKAPSVANAAANVKGADDLRQEIQKLPAYKNLAAVEPIVRSLEKSVKSPDRTSDLDLLYGIATLLDPGSVVRDSDSIAIQRTGGLSGDIQAAISYINSNPQLDPERRAAIMQLARTRAAGYFGALDEALKPYSGIIERRGLNPDDVLPEVGYMRQLVGGQGGPGSPGSLPDGFETAGYTEDFIAQEMARTGFTRDKVVELLRNRLTQGGG